MNFEIMKYIIKGFIITVFIILVFVPATVLTFFELIGKLVSTNLEEPLIVQAIRGLGLWLDKLLGIGQN